ncbi:Sin3 associated polypeptide p18 [Opisthorchis viverrini]|uniref:18 kDa Sin3-associated polypeptide n=2 Tax=Opisthorchis viverrini TaxID=6198 RepID=A0A074ZFS7_OPIVI|nr:hypothetical protein T265_06548 [Opisthorchis viverrini]KER26131.1 hypothetical protein T265_06548 [Opisthorchis viverrini]OON13489.1 Sin3 associated polypeptide p18 [Opisthorchis viverrini]
MTAAIDDGAVNREKTCPLLLRMFYSSVKHNNALEYSRGRTPNNELQVYTWLDATLRELASLVKQVNPESRKRGTTFDFALVTPDSRSPVYRMREIGVVCAGSPSDTDRIMLRDCQFIIGDMIDVAITPAPAPAVEQPTYYSAAANPIDVGGRVPRRNSPYSRGRRDGFSRPIDRGGRFERSGLDDTRRTVIDTTARERRDDYRPGGSRRRERSGSDRRPHETSTSRTNRRVVPY